MNRKVLVLPALVGICASVLVGCGEGGGSEGEADSVAVGTTDRFAVTDDTPAPFDPAGSYDISAWNVMRNTFQTLLRMPRSGTDPVPDAAESCDFTDYRNEQYRCRLREGLTFSDGRALTAEDVEFSIKRVVAVDHDNGPATLLSGIEEVEATGADEIAFHLKKPDATFPHKLATPAASIVDSNTYPADSLVRGFKTVGSGPYVLDGYDGGDKAEFRENPAYKGSLRRQNKRIEMRFYRTSADMEKALRDGDIDLMNRTMSPGQIEKLQNNGDDGIELVEQPGQEIRYLVFDTTGGPTAKKAVRRAVARSVDRKKLVRDVYERTAEPLYSLVPGGLPGHRNSFFNVYGEPDAGAARSTLRAAGITTPVKLTLHYTSDHYGSITAREFAALEKQLEETGLFDVETKGVPWKEYRPAAAKGEYAAYGYGWFPDFPDADNYIAPFFERTNFLNSRYTNSEIRQQIVPETRRETDRAATGTPFGRAQDIVADEVPVLPLWQGKQYIAAGEDITGVEWALNSSSGLQLWEIGHGRSE